MRVVNLAKRPFHNRRPVARLAVVLWVLGGLLLALNLWKWGGHFRGSSNSSDRLDLIERQVSQEETALEDYWQQLRQVRLGSRNQKARYLNLLIHRRTFPWSRLFDELEQVLPDNVYLEDVVPEVKLASDTRRSRARRSSSRALTPRQARERARQRALGQNAAAEEPEEEKSVEEPRDRVALSLGGFARTEEALFEFVDLLYGHDSFLDPNLSREEAQKSGGAVDFRINVVYLTPARETFPVEIEELPPAEGESQTAEAGGEASSPETQELAASGLPQGQEQIAGGAETLATSASEGGEEAAIGAPTEDASELLDNKGPGFVERTLRERRERAAERRSRGRTGSTVDEEDSPAVRGDAGRSTRTGPSRVSVAPRQRTSTGVPVTGGTAAAPTPRAAPNPGTSTRPSTPRSSGRASTPTPSPRDTTPQESEPRGNQGSRNTNRPTPTQPPASGSPRLNGMLEWLPDFLRPELWIPETSIPETSIPETSAPEITESREAA